MTHLEIFHGLVAAGMKMRYGNKPGRAALLRCLWEKKHIMDAGFVDYLFLQKHDIISLMVLPA